MEKRFLIVMMLLLSGGISVYAQEQVFERTYVATDKNAYVAGDRIWCSAFCFDAVSGKLSPFSRVAYMQLVSSEGFVVGSKIDLESGRGSGYIDIPSGVPTGNYKLLSFTALNKNEVGYDFAAQAKTVSIYNTLSTARVPNGVKVLKNNGQVAERPLSDGNVHLDVKSGTEGIELNVWNRTGKEMSYSVSVFHEDGLEQLEPSYLGAFNKEASASRTYRENVLPEYDGEIIYADVVGPDAAKVLDDRDNVRGYISAIGSPNDVYVGDIGPSGKMIFRTGNIYGNKDLVCEINSLDGDIDAHLDIRSPFISIKPEDIPVLNISSDMEGRLVERAGAMALMRSFVTDSLDSWLPRRETLLLPESEVLTYRSEDYTRFNTIREVLTEYVKEVRWRGNKGNVRIEVLAKDVANISQPSWKPSIVMLDGIPIFNHEKMLAYDAMLVDEIQVWQYSYIFGGYKYDGAVNFVTKTSDVAYMDFGTNVRIVDFSGVAYPVNLNKGAGETVLWLPLLTVGAGKSIKINGERPQRPGKYRAVVEGTDEEGNVSVSEVIFEL